MLRYGSSGARATCGTGAGARAPPNALLVLSFAYPEALKASFPEMFKDNEMSTANLQVMLRRVNKKPMKSVYGKIAAVIRDEHRPSSSFRVGSMLFTRTPEDKLICSNSNSLGVEVVPLARSDVAVPAGWVLNIEVDMYVEIPNDNDEKPKHLNLTLTLDKENTHAMERQEVTGSDVVEVLCSTWRPIQEQFSPQLSSPVQIERTTGHQLEVVYTIGR